MKIRRINYIAVLLMFFWYFMPVLAIAQAIPQRSQQIESVSQSLSVSPLTFELTANPGNSLTNKIKISNPSNRPVNIRMTVEDFKPTGETGSVIITEDESYTYSLSQWVSVEPTEFTLPPLGQQVVTFTIDVPAQAEPGGHYGSVLAEVLPSEVEGGSAIAQKVGVLVLLSVAGEVTEQLLVKEFSAPSFIEEGPIVFLLRFENLGTVHVRPKGFISITNMLGKKEADIAFPQKNVLPNSIRKLEVSWDPGFAIGKYTATLVANYGINNLPLTAVITFWVVPWKKILVVFIATFIIITILFLARKRIRLALKVLFTGEK